MYFLTVYRVCKMSTHAHGCERMGGGNITSQHFIENHGLVFNMFQKTLLLLICVDVYLGVAFTIGRISFLLNFIGEGFLEIQSS